MQTYRQSDLKLKNPYANEKTQYNTDARSKVLDNVVRISNHQTGQQATRRLQNDCRPYNRVVALEKAVLADASSILPHDATKESSNHGVEAQLQVSYPYAGLRGVLFEDLLKVHSSKAGDCGGDENCSHTDGVVHGRFERVKIVVDAFVGGRTSREMRRSVVGNGVAELVARPGEEVIGHAMEEKGIGAGHTVGGRAGKRDDGDTESEDDESKPALEAERPT